MKKIIVVFCLLFVCGCGNSNLNVDNTSVSESSSKINKKSNNYEVVCSSDDTSFSMVFKDGQVIKYIDSVDGELGEEIIDIINSEHLVGVTNNYEALRIMDDVMKELDGHCEKK